MLRLEDLRHVSTGTWRMLDHEGFRVREAQTLLGYARAASHEDVFIRWYLLLAVWAFVAERIGEGQLAELPATDRLSVRDRVQESVGETGAEDAQELARQARKKVLCWSGSLARGGIDLLRVIVNRTTVILGLVWGVAWLVLYRVSPGSHLDGASGHAAGTSKTTIPRRPKACPVTPGGSQPRKNPFDVHPKNFTNYRLRWEIYKSNRE